jgi:hypothetical protein
MPYINILKSKLVIFAKIMTTTTKVFLDLSAKVDQELKNTDGKSNLFGEMQEHVEMQQDRIKLILTTQRKDTDYNTVSNIPILQCLCLV